MTIEKYNFTELKSEPAIILSFSEIEAVSFPDLSFDERNMYLLVNKNKRSKVIIVDLASGQMVL